MHSTVSEPNRKPLLIWLGIVTVMVMLMVVVGGMTRLTESGLSMVNWKPIHGTFPPITEAEWQEEFASYQTSPQFQKINNHMSLTEFQGIFWLEYIHRLLGRVTGMVFLLPFLFFMFRGTLPSGSSLRFSGIFLLGGLQGVLGWYMVKSGLVNEPMVSPLRLAAHLTMACLIFSILLWQWLRLFAPSTAPRWNKTVLGFIALLFLQIILGALVAGMDAGLAYETFPTMNGQWLPSGLWLLEPWWQNLYQNPTTAQFVHRANALILMLYLAVMLFQLRHQALPAIARACSYGLIILLVLQITLGALTVLYHVPITIAVLHQFMALLLLGCAITLLYAPSSATRPQ